MTFRPEPTFRHGQPPRTAVLLVNLGTPDEPTPRALRRYLAEFLSDPRVVEIPRAVWWPILIVLYAFFTENTVQGRRIYAVGGNEKAAKLSGIRTDRLVFFCFVNMGVLAALAGMMVRVRPWGFIIPVRSGMKPEDMAWMLFGMGPMFCPPRSQSVAPRKTIIPASVTMKEGMRQKATQ